MASPVVPKDFSSRITIELIQQLLEFYPFLVQLSPIPPSETDRANKPPKGMVTLYEAALFHGNLRVPITPFFLSVCEHYNVAIAQLHPNAVNKIVTFEMFCTAQNVQPLVNVFRAANALVPSDRGWYTFRASVGSMTVSKDNVGNWRRSFFFVNNTVHGDSLVRTAWRKPDDPAMAPKPTLTTFERTLLNGFVEAGRIFMRPYGDVPLHMGGISAQWFWPEYNALLVDADNQEIPLNAFMRREDISDIKPFRRLKVGDPALIAIDQPLLNNRILPGSNDRGKRKVTGDGSRAPKKAKRAAQDTLADEETGSEPDYANFGPIPKDIFDLTGDEDLILPDPGETSNAAATAGAGTDAGAPPEFSRDRAQRVLNRLSDAVSDKARAKYAEVPFRTIEDQYIFNCYNSVCLTVDMVDRHNIMAEENAKETARGNKYKDLSKDLRKQLAAALEEAAAQKARAERAEAEFTKLVQHLPDLSQKITNSAAVAEKFNAFTQAVRIDERCYWHAKVSQCGLVQPLPADDAEELCTDEVAKALLKAAEDDAQSIVIPALQEICQREGVTADDIIALDLQQA